uniref:Cation/H+ exchanger protein 2 n=1 Tax=Sinocyclocheilus grahami TaxID=75366 RepID=A0A672NXL4_SINGR
HSLLFAYTPKHTQKSETPCTLHKIKGVFFLCLKWDENPCKTTISAENEVEAQKFANNYKFGFWKWKSHVTERPFQDRSDIVKELYSELNVIKPYSGSLIACGNVLYVFLFGWWISLVYVFAGLLMFLTVFGIPYAKLCWRLSFTVDLLPLVIVSLVIGYVDKSNQFVSFEVKFASAVSSIIPLSYYIGMGIASISAQSNFDVRAVVNATFGSITELTFYITALLRGHHQGNKCLQEIVKEALTGTLLGCILFIPWICMIIGGFRHREQRFNSRSAGVSSSLLFISIGGKTSCPMGIWCEDCTNSTATNSSGSFMCKNCHYDLVRLQTSHLGASVHWSRWRALLILIVATVLMSSCANLTTEHIQPTLSRSSISQYFIGVTLLAMVPEIPEIVNGVQFALQNTISLRLVGRCIAVQMCMIQIPILVLFTIFYDVGFVVIFSNMHLWASIFSVILVNYIFMDGKSAKYYLNQGLVILPKNLIIFYIFLIEIYIFIHEI